MLQQNQRITSLETALNAQLTDIDHQTELILANKTPANPTDSPHSLSEPDIPTQVTPQPESLIAASQIPELSSDIQGSYQENKLKQTHRNNADQSDGYWPIFSHFFNWLWKGNPLAKIGILLLFLGVAYLLKFSVQNDVLSPQVRLLISAIGCLILLAVGWYLRHKKALFALILQGGAIGCLYITIFAAFKLYDMLPYSMAFVAMALICVASVILALLQSAISLAILASLGGYLAPVLLSMGGGSHIILFSYYLMLSIAILIISVWQTWRPLNLVGMVMTYSVAVLWGWNNYQEEYYVSSQLFLIANLIVFNVLTQLFSLRFPHDKQMVVDYTLLFIPPFVSIALQYAISSHIPYVPAFVALMLGLFYLLAGYQLHKRYNDVAKELALGNVVIGVAFVTLAIPLALAFEWTSIIWSVEGLLLLWYGFQQQNKKLILVGVLLILTSVITLLGGFSLYTWSRASTYMIPVLLVACFCAGAIFNLHRNAFKSYNFFSHCFLVIGLVVWCFWIPVMTDILSWSYESEIFIVIALVIISACLWRFLAIKSDWITLLLCQSIVWLTGYYYLILDFIDDINPMGRGESSLIWPVLLGSSILFVIHTQNARNIKIQRILHGATFWLILIFIATEVNWFVTILPWGMTELGYFIYIMSITLVILTLYGLQSQKIVPMKRNAMTYWYNSLPMAGVLICISIIANFNDGKLTFWNYIPLINPLDEGGLFSIASILLIKRGITQKLKRVTELHLLIIRGLGLAAIILSILWFNGILLRALSDYADINWDFDALFTSRLVQTILSISWSVIALGFMIFAGMKQNRKYWFFGAGVFGCVIAKLFLVDIYGQDGLSRAISFIAVAVLILVVGYFSPLPPKIISGTENQEAVDEINPK